MYDRSEKTYDRPEKNYDRPEKYESELSANELEICEKENRDLRLKISRLESGEMKLQMYKHKKLKYCILDLAEKEAELARVRSQKPSLDSKFDRAEIERYRAAQLQAERLLEAREQSHRQQISRLESQVNKYTLEKDKIIIPYFAGKIT